jgi:RecB family exonuclease
MDKRSKFRVSERQTILPPRGNQESGIRNHQVYTGSFAVLEERWIATISELQGEDSLCEINVLVGSNILATYLKRRLAQSGRTAANVRFLTFLGLVERLASVRGTGPEKPWLPRIGASILLEDLLAQRTPPVYGEVSGFRGFRDSLLETFRDLRDAGFTPSRLDAAVQRGSDPDRSQQLLGLADLYRRFRERISVFHDVDNDFRAAIREVAEKGDPLSFRQLIIYGIYDMTGQQARLLNALKDSLDLIYFIPFVGGAVSEFALPFLESRRAELDVEPIHLKSGPSSNSLESMAGRAFGFSGGETPPCSEDGSFALVSAPGESRAAVEIVREIFRAVYDGIIHGFHEAAVILHQPESDIPVLTEMFRLRGVPYFIHGGLSFAERPLGRAVLALSRLGGSSFAREAVLSTMELVAAALPSESTPGWDVQEWRAATNDPRFLAGLESWDLGLKNLLEKLQANLSWAEAHPDPEEEEENERSTARSAEVIRQRIRTLEHLRDAWQHIRHAAAGWPVSLPWNDWAELLETRFEPLLGKSSDWERFTSILDDLGSMRALKEQEGRSTDRGTVSAEKLRSAFTDAIASRTFPVGNFQRSGVNLLSTSVARGLRFPLVIIPGLDEGRFPARLRQDPLLLDAERLRMGTLPIRSKRIDEEKLLFDMASRSAEKRLVLMTSRLDEGSDRERIPSQFFLRAASAVRGRTVTIRELAPESLAGFRAVSLDNPAPERNQFPVDEEEIRLRMITEERKSSGAAVRMLAQLDPVRLSRPLQFDQERWVPRLTAFDGFISDPTLIQWTAQRLGISAGQVSASRIEEYAKCPYLFFLKRAMKLQAWEEQGKVEGMDPLDRGVVIHTVLEKFLGDFGEEVFLSDANTLRRALEATARATLEGSRPAGVPDLLWDIERDGLIAMLQGWLEFELSRADPEMRVARLEQQFGEFGQGDKFPAYELQAGRHRFRFRGRIDRVDLSRDGRRARVVDYKTGRLPDPMANKSTRSPLMSGERIQLLIYTGALSVFEKLAEIESIEGEYLHLQPKDGLTVPCGFTHEELLKAGQALPDLLEIIGDGIENGVFFARTRGRIRPSGHCDYCDYLPICGKDRVRREDRKAADPEVRRFTRTLESL